MLFKDALHHESANYLNDVCSLIEITLYNSTHLSISIYPAHLACLSLQHCLHFGLPSLFPFPCFNSPIFTASLPSCPFIYIHLPPITIPAFLSGLEFKFSIHFILFLLNKQEHSLSFKTGKENEIL
jgi:hypothetical protein